MDFTLAPDQFPWAVAQGRHAYLFDIGDDSARVRLGRNRRWYASVYTDRGYFSTKAASRKQAAADLARLVAAAG